MKVIKFFAGILSLAIALAGCQEKYKNENLPFVNAANDWYVKLFSEDGKLIFPSSGYVQIHTYNVADQEVNSLWVDDSKKKKVPTATLR